MSRWRDLFDRQRAQERAGTVLPLQHAQERAALRAELDRERPPQQDPADDAGAADDD